MSRVIFDGRGDEVGKIKIDDDSFMDHDPALKHGPRTTYGISITALSYKDEENDIPENHALLFLEPDIAEEVAFDILGMVTLSRVRQEREDKARDASSPS